jgi:CRISPR/Cas system-associated exonuclease Cas4 (RecB family)
MRTIRASEIGSYIFCHRSWWYQVRGYQSENIAELAGGSELHEQHGRRVMVAGCLKTLAYLALILAIVTMTMYLIGKVI